MIDLARVTLADIEAEAIRREGLAGFVRRAWRHIDSSPLSWNWHIDAVCEHLEAFARGDIRTLVINQPPGTSKSSVVSILFPAWMWGAFNEPDHRFLYASHSQELSHTFARKSRTLMESEWYKARWPHVRFATDRTASTAVGFFQNTEKGYRHSITVPSAEAFGAHPDSHVIDDPNNPQDAQSRSRVAMEATLQWWRGTMATRFRNLPRARKLVTMQRLHVMDLAGELIREGATVLCLPMRCDRTHPNWWPKDPREQGELLDPVRVPEDTLATLELTLGPSGTVAQMGQRPAPAGGGIFKQAWFKYWTELPPGGEFTISVDCAFKDLETSSFVVIQVWYQVGPNFYLVDQHREQMSFSRTCNAIYTPAQGGAPATGMAVRWPRAYRKLVEAKANGVAVVDQLSQKLYGLELVEPDGGKEARANAVEPIVASGNVYVPDPVNARYPDGRRGAPWVLSEFFPEVTVFPNAATDDQVDTMTQFLNYAAPRGMAQLVDAMAILKKEMGLQ